MRRSLLLLMPRRRRLPPPRYHHQSAAALSSSSSTAPATPAPAPASASEAVLLEEALARVHEGGTAEGTNLVAYSGGVDSSLVAALLFRAYPRNAFACIGTVG